MTEFNIQEFLWIYQKNLVVKPKYDCELAQ
jgi:hypothetical protein